MKKYTIIFFLFLSLFTFSCYSTTSHPAIDGFLKNLDTEILKRDVYLKQKQLVIDSLKKQLKVKNSSDICKYNLYSSLSDQYRSFMYDSALVYTQKMLETSIKLKNKTKENTSKIKLSFVLLSSGLFTEAKEMLESIHIEKESDELRLQYFNVYARIYYDLAVYANDSYYSDKYKVIGNVYLDSVIHLEKNPQLHLAAVALKTMKQKDYPTAIKDFEQLLSKPNLPNHEIAMAASSLGHLYSLRGDKEKSIAMLIKASIADIQSVTKETVALRNLASQLFNYDNDFDKAYDYIDIAYQDAQFYNARHRMAEVATVLPIIQRERMKSIEGQRNQYVRFLIIMSLLVVIAVIFLFIIIKQNKKLSETKDLILKSNADLQKTNGKLQETNKIKEEYIGYFFRMNSEYIQKQTTLRRKIAKMINNKEFDKLKNVISDEDLEEQRLELYKSFDKIFLKIFPSFIDEFNNLFNEDDKIKLNKSELLNTDLRIYALIRLGIRDNEDIAEFLNYSVNTIYTYKTKIKNKSIVDNDEFEKKIMQIKAA